MDDNDGNSRPVSDLIDDTSVENLIFQAVEDDLPEEEPKDKESDNQSSSEASQPLNDDEQISSDASGSLLADIYEPTTLDHTPQWQRLFSYMVSVSLGCSMLLPFNAIIGVPDYWETEYPGANFEFAASMIFSLGNPFVYLIMIFLLRLLSPTTWLATSMTGIIAVFLVLPVVPFIFGGFSKYVALGLIFLCGIMYSVMGSAVMSIASSAGSAHIQAVMTGQGTAGIAAIGLRIVTKVFIELGLIPAKYEAFASAMLFFSVAGLLFASAFPLYLAEKAMQKAAAAHASSEPEEDMVALTAPDPTSGKAGSESETLGDQLEDGLLGATEPGVAVDGVAQTPTKAAALGIYLARIWMILRAQWPFNFSVAAVFCVTTACFPGLVTAVPSIVPVLNRTGWFPVIQLTIFMIGDQAGRFVTKYRYGRVPRRLVAPLSIVRAVLSGPAFLALYILRARFAFDPFPMLLTAAFAVSNGILGAESFMFAGDKVPPELRDLSGVLMQLSQMTALLIGTILGLLFAYIPAI
ncbi:Equilibrative nucleoside transporter [Carpediemonas membranifera]|uniref:Equilibrative nucleoside transporter n=1 Tax=Carpediemonas membranifera TaxID=201153 RepID=A0A8J6E255_9EUKA|nr:Equilibrative nucleoside transporter [Carpediemonas membranifera]|eukprot:KAG9393896.1 Equilibrative nucleoside transporter [Carpediemonas membranifera]